MVSRRVYGKYRTEQLPKEKPSKSRKAVLWFVALIIIVCVIVIGINQSNKSEHTPKTQPPQPPAIRQPARQEPVKPKDAALPKIESQPKLEAVIPTTRTQPQVGEVMINTINMKLVYIPAGEFMMGSPPGEAERVSCEDPQHRVRIGNPFWMGATEVTQAQWQAVMGNNPSYFKGEKLPVENVSWDDATAFCKKLSEKEKKHYRLPTEAQWEYACRAGTATPFNTGETISTDQANYDGHNIYGSGRIGIARQKTTEVGSFPANGFGLHDMHGNVWEWCSDWYDDKYYSKSPDADPENMVSGEYRVLRGGSWDVEPGRCRSAHRHGFTPDYRFFNCFGFRVVVLDLQ